MMPVASEGMLIRVLQEVLLRSGPCSAHPTGANRKETGRLRFHLTSVKERTDSKRSQSKLRGDFFPSATRGECLGKMTRHRGLNKLFRKTYGKQSREVRSGGCDFARQPTRLEKAKTW